MATTGMQPDFQVFFDSFWHCVQAMSGTPYPGSVLIAVETVFGTRCVGNVQDMTGTSPDFQAFMGNVREASGLLQGYSLIFKHLWVVSGTRCAGHVQDVAGTQSDFQAFLGSFWDTVCRPRPGCIWATAGS
ncbi:Hypothetical predicted protein [Olea europaea subsp. europaea]|uniref:Uncharacterized protein n=1 Tax=Olea europaea subsp. europaea TaxID=158383 RepID=A0A8S0PUW7_OLEEU|nr:Hypothetical predicted protein [Olea europaea subsp. europaea]